MFVHFAKSPTRHRSSLAALRRFHTDEEGAAYTLSYVMVIPVYALLICLIIETCLMLTAKLGTVYAAYAAARTASVWSSHTTWEKAHEKANHAAIRSMTPFASGTQSLLASAPVDDPADALSYLAAYEAFAEKSVSSKYLLAKYGYASRHTAAEIAGPPATWDADITAKVTYEFPFNVPGIGRLLGRRGVDGRYYYSLTSEATVPNEGPQDNRNTIGIGYGTLE